MMVMWSRTGLVRQRVRLATCDWYRTDEIIRTYFQDDPRLRYLSSTHAASRYCKAGLQNGANRELRKVAKATSVTALQGII